MTWDPRIHGPADQLERCPHCTGAVLLPDGLLAVRCADCGWRFQGPFE